MKDWSDIYFIGIGGIGMSAIARYYNRKGYRVSGYDKTASPLTAELEAEGISVHYEDNTDFINQLSDMPGVKSADLVSYNGDYMG